MGASKNTLAVGDNAKLVIELDATNVSPAFRLEGAGSSSSTINGLAITHLASASVFSSPMEAATTLSPATSSA